MNSVNIIGRIGQEPELNYTESGKAVCNISVAVESPADSTTWVTVVCWEDTAENVVQYQQKGNRVGVSGRLQQRKWQTQDGSNRTVLEIVAYRVDFLGNRREEQPEQPKQSEATGDIPEDAEADPFEGV